MRPPCQSGSSRPPREPYVDFPQVLDLPPVYTRYDAARILNYAELLEAEDRGTGWREAAKAILECDPDEDEAGSRRCWEAHIERARLILDEVFEDGVQKALGQSPV